jgi:hypothetical protein
LEDHEFTAMQSVFCVSEGTVQSWKPNTAATISLTQSTQFITYNYPSLTLTQLAMVSICTLVWLIWGKYN